jgi:hypothetical protein
LADVRVVKSGDGLGFALETLGESGVRDFDGDCAVEAGIACLPDFAHAAAAERGLKLLRN